MPESNITKHLRDGTFRIVIGANTYTVKYEDGDLKLDVPGPTVEHYLDRGRLADVVGGEPSLRYGEDQPMEFSFTARLRDLGTASYVTLSQFITKTGQYFSTWGTTMGANGEVKTADFYWDVAGTVHGDAGNRTLYMPYVYIKGAIEEGGPNKIAVQCTSYCLYPTVT